MVSWNALLAACLLLATDDDHKEQMATFVATALRAVFNGFDDVQCFSVFTRNYDDVSLIFLKYFSHEARFSFVMEFGGRRGDCPAIMMMGKNGQDIMRIRNKYVHMLRNSLKSSVDDGTQTLSKTYIPVLLVVHNSQWVQNWPVYDFVKRRSALGVETMYRQVAVAGPAPFRTYWGNHEFGRFVRLDRRLVQAHQHQDDVLQRWPNIRGEEIRMAVTHLPPFMFSDGDGVEIKIVKTLANALNGRVTFEPTGNDTSFWQMSIHWTSKSLTNVTGGLALNLAVSQKLDYGVPWSTGCGTLLVPRPLPSYGDAAALLRPLAPTVWLALLMALLGTGLTLLVVTRLQPGARRHPLRIVLQPDGGPVGARGRGRGRAWAWRRRQARAGGRGGLLEALGVLLATANPPPFPAPRPALRRALLFCWNVVAIQLVTAYNSGLLAHLTAPHFPPPVDSLQQFVDAGFYWGSFTFLPPLDIYFDPTNPTHQAVKARFKKERTPHDLAERLARGDYAQLGNYIAGSFCPLGLPPPPAALPRLRLLQESIRCDANALAFPPYSALRPWADRVVMLLAQAGLIEHWLRGAAARVVQPALLGAAETEGPAPLGLGEVAVVLALLAAGLGGAGLAFAAEALSAPAARALRRLRLRLALRRLGRSPGGGRRWRWALWRGASDAPRCSRESKQLAEASKAAK